MKLIIESGGTKTDWVILNKNNGCSKWQTDGIYPLSANLSTLIGSIKNAIGNQETNAIQEIFYYGTGVTDKQIKEKITNAFLEIFPSASVKVFSDIYAVGHSLSPKQPSLLGIFGTGSNLCFFDGYKVKEQQICMGYLLDDEGSGMHMGKTILKAYLRHQLPSHLYQEIKKAIGKEGAAVVKSLYEQERPQLYISEIMRNLAQYIEDPYIKDVATQSFDSFFSCNMSFFEQYPNYQLNCVGTIAYIFREELKDSALRSGVQLGKICKAPLEGLIQYYQNKEGTD